MTTQERDADWDQIREIVNRGLRSSLHCSVSTINEDGSPHLTPIGSVHLDSGWQGRYLELFATGLGRNLDRDPRLSLLAVDSAAGYWLSSLEQGQFDPPPAIRLAGTASPRRPPRPGELDELLAFAAGLRGLKGYDLLWGRGGASVRDLNFDRVAPVRIGAMTEPETSKA